MLDCIVIGGGPAGLTAALYLARYNRNFILIDDGDSRAAWIPESHNIPVFAQGISGREILKRQRAHALLYGARLAAGTVTALQKTGRGFAIEYRDRDAGHDRDREARFILLATGVADLKPNIPDVADAIQKGLIRYCPICDGYEAKDKRVAVIAHGKRCLGEAIFIARTYTPDVTILSYGQPMELSEEESEALERYRIAVVLEPMDLLIPQDGKVTTKSTHSGKAYEFDIVYSALGVEYRCRLATAAGARSDSRGGLEIDAHGQTTVPGLFAAGDVTQGLNQIVVAMGQAAIAATAIHNRF